MANHFSILGLRTPWTGWKGKKALCNCILIVGHKTKLGKKRDGVTTEDKLLIQITAKIKYPNFILVAVLLL